MTPHCNMETLQALTPTAPDWAVRWPAIWALWPQLPALDTCPQDPRHHAEGDVGTHTRMVVEALVSDPEWRSLDDKTRSILFWSAVLHDIGKPACTKTEDDGRITSKGHSRVGASIARRLLWEAEVPFRWREAICDIISVHQLPYWLIDRPDPVRKAIETSWRCRPDLTCLHARADGTGRICDDKDTILENIELAREIFRDADCYTGPFAFANDESRVAFYEREDRDPHFAAFEDYRCTATVMSALPGSGKDTWIARHRPDLPVVSLDDIREEIGVKPTDDQGKVIQLAHERAREHLRGKRDFIWNGTNVTRQTRSRIVRLLRDYGARIEMVYLEPSRSQLFAQNRSRSDAVPDKVIEKLASKLEPPGLDEAHDVQLAFQ